MCNILNSSLSRNCWTPVNLFDALSRLIVLLESLVLCRYWLFSCLVIMVRVSKGEYVIHSKEKTSVIDCKTIPLNNEEYFLAPKMVGLW